MVQCRVRSRPGMGGVDGVEPVARTTAWRARRRRSVAVGAGHDDRALPRQPRGAPHHLQPLADGPAHLAAVVPVVGEGGAPREHPRGVQRPGDGGAGALHAPGGSDRLPRAQQRLGRHAGVVRALPAHQGLLDQRHRQAALVGVARGDLPDGPRTDDDDVDGLVCLLPRSCPEPVARTDGGATGAPRGVSAAAAGGPRAGPRSARGPGPAPPARGRTRQRQVPPGTARPPSRARR